MTKQVIIAQADILAASGTFSNHSSGIWWRREYLTEAEKAASFWAVDFGGSFDDTRDDSVVISSFAVGVDRYLQRFTVANTRFQDQQFTYEFSNQSLYVSYLNRAPYWRFPERSAGEALNFADVAQTTDLGPTFSQYGEEYVDPRLVSGSVNDQQTLDKLEDQKFTYNEYTFSLRNSDGELDNIRSQIINQESRILIAEVPDDQLADETDFELIRFGIVSSVSFSDGEVSVSVIDPRGAYKDTVGLRLLKTTDWPALNERLEDKRIPLLLGRATVPGIQVDATEFLIADTFYGDLTDVHAVYVDGSSVSFTEDLAAGTVTISGYTSGKVSIDTTGLNITNVIDQIIWFFETFANTFETDEFFDLAQVQAMRDKGYTGAYYVGTSGEKLNDILAALSSGINMWIYPKTGGVYGMKDITPEIPVSEILFDELSGLPERSYDDETFVSQMSIEYNKDYSEDETITIVDASLEDEAIENQQSTGSASMVSTVTGASDAAALLLAAYEQRIFAPEIVTVSLPAPLSFDLADYVAYTHQRVYDPLGEDVKVIIPRSRWRVISASRVNRSATLRRIDDYPENIEDMTMLDFNGNPSNLIYLDFNGNGSSDIISFGEVG
jgi:hypothetical protein